MRMVERWTHRSDAWTHEDDEQLQTLVLRHIREGSTQLAAFIEAAGLLGRTPAACGYRWNGVLRKGYEKSIREAKAERKQRLPGRSHAPLVATTRSHWRNERMTSSAPSLLAEDRKISPTMQVVVDAIRTYDQQLVNMERDNEQLQATVDRQQALIDQLKEENAKLQQLPPLSPTERLSEDSRTLLDIMDRARKLLGPIDASSGSNARFRMDRNGNLDRVLE